MRRRLIVWRLLVLAIVAGLLCVLVSVYFYFPCFRFYGPVRGTQLNLLSLRNKIAGYRAREGCYPTCLSEIYVRADDGSEAGSPGRVPKELLSGSQWSGSEFNVLNGKGGWYYDPNTGEVKISLREPVKQYLRFYFGKRRNEIPSDW